MLIFTHLGLMIENDLCTKVFTCSYQHKVIAVKK